MNRLSYWCLKTVRLTSWPLLLLILGFILTGYMMSGRFGLDRVLNEKAALALHKLLHLPMIVLLIAHVVPSLYLAFKRWGWLGKSS